jgi:acetyltransferase-like isoleucine patch superfamily enzyme
MDATEATIGESPTGPSPVESRRKDRLTTHPAPDGRNSLVLWHRTVAPWRVLRNGFLIQLSYYVPSLALKRRLYRLMGMHVGKHVSFAWRTTPDLFFPELIHVGDNSIIGYNTTILAHEYLLHEWRTGPVWIGANVTVGANCTILPGVVVGDGATVSAMSLVNKDVPPGTVVGGVPIHPLSEHGGSTWSG